MFNFDKLNETRKNKGITAKHLCEAVGKDRYYISNCKYRNINIPDEFVSKWAAMLGTSPEYLRDETDDPLSANTDKKANIDKIKSIAKSKGIKIKYICQQLGLAETYLSNVKNGRDRMTDERLAIIADLLQTSVAYLRDETNDSSPEQQKKPADNGEPVMDEDMRELMYMFSQIPEDKREETLKLFEASLKLHGLFFD